MIPVNTIIIRLELTSGGRTRLDYISLDIDPSADVDVRPEYRPDTWGAVKALWR